MVKKNPSNPFSEDEGETKQNSPLPISKARVETVNPKDNGGRHTAFVREYGSRSPKLATVLSPAYGDVAVPEEGSDVAIMYGNKDKPWIIGHWYAIDRVEDKDIDLPDYEEGDRVVSNGTRQELHITNDGKIQLGYQPDYDLPPFNYIEIDEKDILVSADEELTIRSLNNDINVSSGGSIELQSGGTPVDKTTHATSMYPSSNSDVPSNSESIIPFDTTEYDFGGIADTANNAVNISEAGVYQVTCRVTTDNVNNENTSILRMKVNGTNTKANAELIADGTTNTIEMTTHHQFSAGDTLQFAYFNADLNDSATIRSGVGLTELSISFLASQSVQ